jgi:C4-dicarboxylate-binding protein DctP
MRKRSCACIVSIVIFVSVIFLGGYACAASEQITLKISSAMPAFDVRTKTLQFWIDLVEKGTEGRVTGKVFPGGSLVNLKDSDVAVSQGIVDVAFCAASYTAPHFRIFDLFGFPGFCAPDPKMILKLDQAVRPILDKVLANGGIKYLFPTDEGEMSADIRKGKGPLRTNADWKGLKIRVPNKERGKLISIFGAAPVVLPVGDQAVALERGTIDGVLTAWPIDLAQKLYETAPNVTMLDVLTAQWGFVAMNMKTFERISSNDQKVILEAGEKAAVFNGESLGKQKTQYLGELKKAGITPYYFSEKDKKIFLQNGYNLMDERAKDATGEMLELYNALKPFRQ